MGYVITFKSSASYQVTSVGFELSDTFQWIGTGCYLHLLGSPRLFLEQSTESLFRQD